MTGERTPRQTSSGYVRIKKTRATTELQDTLSTRHHLTHRSRHAMKLGTARTHVDCHVRNRQPHRQQAGSMQKSTAGRRLPTMQGRLRRTRLQAGAWAENQKHHTQACSIDLCTPRGRPLHLTTSRPTPLSGLRAGASREPTNEVHTRHRSRLQAHWPTHRQRSITSRPAPWRSRPHPGHPGGRGNDRQQAGSIEH